MTSFVWIVYTLILTVSLIIGTLSCIPNQRVISPELGVTAGLIIILCGIFYYPLLSVF